MPETELREDDILKDMPHLGLDDKITFRCDPSLDCFTRCCRDVSILLTPYDVLRMKRALGMSSTEFLAKHTITMQSQDKQIPVVFLKMDKEAGGCPFLSPKGCQVYQHRPWACRMYPLGMAEPEGPAAAARRFFFVVREELCHGHGVGNGFTVREWLDNQDIEIYDAMQTSFRRLMAHPDWAKEELPPQKLAMYYMACYDLDRFRRFVFETRFLEFFDVDEARVEALRTDDEELLELGMAWLAFSLFHEKSMRLQKNIVPPEPKAATTAGEPSSSPA